MRQSTVLIIFLIVTNFVTSGFAFYFLYTSGRMKILFEHSQYRYDQNDRYVIRTSVFKNYTMQKNIVFIGGSHTEYINWGEFLNRCDIANRGIGSDITDGYLHRISSVISLKPKLCFIEGGINDIVRDIPIDTIISNLKILSDRITKIDAVPILHTVTYVADWYPESASVNRSVDRLNKRIIQMAKSNNIDLIDLNGLTSDNGFISRKFVSRDGIHYCYDGYVLWRGEIYKAIKKYLFDNNIQYLSSKTR